MVDTSRQAGAHPFDGIYAFEVFRSILGDEAAERILRTKYDLEERPTACADLPESGVDFSDRNRLYLGF